MRSRLQSCLLVALCLLAVPSLAQASYKVSGEFGDIDLGGHIRTTNIFRHNAVDTWHFIMQRNTVKLRLEWKFLQNGKTFGRKISWLDRSDFFLVLRGVYDSIYDFKPGQGERQDIRGTTLTANDVDIGTIPDPILDRIKWQLEIREAYVDLYFKRIPLHLRIGRQQIVWGETDGIRMLDRANPLDLSWHFFQELPPPGFGFDEIRLPLFFVKGLWDFQQVGNLSQTFLEWYWNPGDWRPAKVSFLPRPWGVRLLDPIFNSKGTGVLQASAPNLCGRAAGGNCESLMFGTTLLRQGNYDRDPFDNSQFGIRFHFITEGGFEWSLNYLYARFGPDGTPAAPVRGVPVGKTFTVPNAVSGGTRTVTAQTFCEGLARDPSNPLNQLLFPWAANQICLEAFSPYVHTVGASLNWFEAEYTQTVWRMETIVDFGVPLYDGDKQVALFAFSPTTGGGQPPIFPGITNVNMWKGMIAFDRPTWIKALNKKTTFFVTGQLFWHHIIDYKKRKCAIGDISDPSDPNFKGFVHATSDTADSRDLCGVSGGPFLLPGESWGFIGIGDLPNISNPGRRLRDNVREWEVLFTLAILGFYRGGTLVPAMIYIMDPINSLSQELAIGFDWFIIPDVAFNLTTRLLWAGMPWDPYGGINDRDLSQHDLNQGRRKGLIFDPWFLAGGSRGRSETSFQLTWQF